MRRFEAENTELKKDAADLKHDVALLADALTELDTDNKVRPRAPWIRPPLSEGMWSHLLHVLTVEVDGKASNRPIPILLILSPCTCIYVLHTRGQALRATETRLRGNWEKREQELEVS